MSILGFLFHERQERRTDDVIVLRRMIDRWSATGTVPVAHIVADLGAIGEVTREHEAFASPSPAPRESSRLPTSGRQRI